jgi:DivIVA domain-containing protein
MIDLLVTLAVIVVVGGAIFAAAARLLERTPGLAAAPPDGAWSPLPEGRALTGVDVRGLRFDTAVRGYRMAQVDSALARLDVELETAHSRITQLESALAQLGASGSIDPGQ